MIMNARLSAITTVVAFSMYSRFESGSCLRRLLDQRELTARLLSL